MIYIHIIYTWYILYVYIHIIYRIYVTLPDLIGETSSANNRSQSRGVGCILGAILPNIQV